MITILKCSPGIIMQKPSHGKGLRGPSSQKDSGRRSPQ